MMERGGGDEFSSRMKNEGEAEYSAKTNVVQFDGLISSKSNNMNSTNSSSNSNSNILKPLINGCLTGQVHGLVRYWNFAVDCHFHDLHYNRPDLNKKLHHLKLGNLMHLKLNLIFGATHSTASLGLFEILTKKLRSRNDGGPLSLYQEACCGLVSGAAATFTWCPFKLASSQITPQNFSYSNLFNTMSQMARNEGAFAFWKGSSSYLSTKTAANAGMIVSYNRSVNYLMESKGFSKWNAVISASIISGFSGVACGQTSAYVILVKDVVKKKYDGGNKNAYRKIPLYASEVLSWQRGIKFYAGLFNYIRQLTGFCVVQWHIFEIIRAVEESMDGKRPRF